jgi:putative hydrolase of the HAD superfamily
LLKRAIIFDLDDTLVAFDAVSLSSWRQVCQEYAQTSGRTSAQHLYETVKKHSDWYWSDETRHRDGRRDIKAARRSIVSAAFSELGLPQTEAVFLADRYSAVRLENMYLLPDVESTLQALCDRHFEMAILTNGESVTQREKIKRFGLGKYFSHIFIEGEVGFGKPEQEIYRKALSDIGVSPDETYMVGDNLQWDVAAPQALGIRSVWYDCKGAGLPSDAPTIPFRTILRITELLDIL